MGGAGQEEAGQGGVGPGSGAGWAGQGMAGRGRSGWGGARQWGRVGGAGQDDAGQGGVGPGRVGRGGRGRDRAGWSGAGQDEVGHRGRGRRDEPTRRARCSVRRGPTPARDTPCAASDPRYRIWLKGVASRGRPGQDTASRGKTISGDETQTRAHILGEKYEDDLSFTAKNMGRLHDEQEAVLKATAVRSPLPVMS